MTINYLNKLQQLANNNKLPQAILLVGENQVCRELAINFATWLFSKDNINLSRHPDYLLIELSSTQEITIDIIRDINIFASSVPYLGDRKIVIVNNFHNINNQAANAFLKTLEEPLVAANIIFLLISNSTRSLPLTVLSRTLQINILSLNSNAIQDKHNILQDLYDVWVLEKDNYIAILEKWYTYDKHELLSCLWFILTNILKSVQDIKLLQIKQKIPQNMLWQLLDGLNYINKSIILSQAVNWQLFLDNFIFIKVIEENFYGR